MLDGRSGSKNSIALLAIVAVFSFGSNAQAEATGWSIGLETGLVWQDYNDVRIPGDSGTRFSLADLVGKDPLPFYRLEFMYDLSDKHQIRLLAAPFDYTETGVLDKTVDFDGETFAPDQNTQGSYKFNSYRASYRYRVYSDEQWSWHVGGTLKVRDAEIALQQGAVSASSSNVGFVPLLNLYGVYTMADKWRLIVDFDGLASPQGRALDLGLKVNYDIVKNWHLGAGLRGLEGGADNDEVYNFAQFNYAVISAGYRFY